MGPISPRSLLRPLKSAVTLFTYFTLCLCSNLIVRSDAFIHPQSHTLIPFKLYTSFTNLYSTVDDVIETIVVSERVRAAVFQAPASQSQNPLEILTEVADSLRVASLHAVDVVVYPELYLRGSSSNNGGALDRESYELNIIGNMCGELNVACIIGYVEAVHESEQTAESGVLGSYYNSIAAFNADGSRAGNYQSVSKSAFEGAQCKRGSPFVEFIPATLTLPTRDATEAERTIKVGMMCGNDILKPEHSLHLVRCGAQALVAPCSFKNNNNDLRALKYVTATRAIENNVPFIMANKESTGSSDMEGDDFIGSSAIVSQDGEYLVCGPETEGGDMPSDSGYLIPCENGALYAADIDISTSCTSTVIQHSMKHWDLNPLVPDAIGSSKKEDKRESHGFGNSTGRKRMGKKIKR